MQELADLIAESERVVAFTGAGVSTESGLPDFRSPGGLWTRYDPMKMTFSRYVDSVDVRRESWAMRREFFAKSIEPNAAHRALARLEEAGRCLGVVTQNIDGLHQAAGSRTVVELHGTAREVECIGHRPTGGIPDGCGWRAPYTWALEQIDSGDDDPSCPQCGGLVKSATVSFEQVLPPENVERAYDLVSQADLLIAAGSSLQVYPAAGLPEAATAHGARLAIVNIEPTPLDDLATLVVHGSAGEVIGPAVEAVLGGS